MSYRITIKPSAEKELNKYSLKIYEQIVPHIFSLQNNPRPFNYKKLKSNIYRVRSGDYRIIYTIDDINKIVEVTKVAHRKDVYR
ncbi:MAG: type II toxin-antitoxin system RelE/ParE family toxin [Elusimicrobiota bacterium]